MAILFLTYDLEAMCIRRASVEGKVLEGPRSVALRTGSASVLDGQGRDLLGGPPQAADAPPADGAEVQLQIARLLGFQDAPEESPS